MDINQTKDKANGGWVSGCIKTDTGSNIRFAKYQLNPEKNPKYYIVFLNGRTEYIYRVFII